MNRVADAMHASALTESIASRGTPSFTQSPRRRGRAAPARLCQVSLIRTDVPNAQADGHDCPRLIDEFVPGVATVLKDVVIGLEDAIGEPVVADELPDVFDRV